jgi:hypothetical protein
MKRFGFAALVLALAVGAMEAWAANSVVCSVAVTSSASNTASATTGTCSWQAGAVVAMQCDTAVYYDQQAGGTATSADFKVEFSANSDPYLITLTANEKHISLLRVSADGTCKFAPMQKRK